MFARVAAAKGTSSGKSTKAVRNPAPERSFEYFAQQQEPAGSGAFSLGESGWNIGNIAISEPADRGGSKSPQDCRSGATRPIGWPLWPVQAKLAIGAIDDPLEREADRMAEHVMRMPDSRAASGSVLTFVRRQHMQRCSCGKASSSGICEACKQKEEELRRKQDGDSSPETAPAIVEQVLSSPGQPLDRRTRNFMEPRFGADFSGVRVHADSKAAESARAVGALAYTVGSHIVFRAEQSASYQANGDHLLAHELGHVLQQEAAPVQGHVQRLCGKEDIEKSPNSTCAVAVAASGTPHGPRFRFKLGCDEFAPGEEARLRKHLKAIPSTSQLEVFGMASSEGEPGFNEALACARTHAALEVIKDEHLDQNVETSGGFGPIPGTFGVPDFRAVVIQEKKGGPPTPSATDPELQNVFLVTGDKPNVVLIDKGDLLKITLDKAMVALGTADIAGGGDCGKFTLGFFQICRPFDVQRIIYHAPGTDLEDDRSDQIRGKEPALDVFNPGDIWTYSAAANCANPGVLRSTPAFFEDTPSTGFAFPPAGDYIKGIAWHDYFFTAFSVQHPDGTIHHLKSFYWDIHYCESFDAPAGSDKMGKSRMKKSNVNIGPVLEGAPAEPGLQLAGHPAASTCNQIIRGTRPNLVVGSFDIDGSC